MSFDIFVQAFKHAEVYGVPAPDEPLTGLMFNGVSGDGWDVIVAVARAAELTIMPVGCPVCLVSEAQRAHLPPDLARSGVAVVTSGAALRAAIETGRR